jgi:hypothetical protein
VDADRIVQKVLLELNKSIFSTNLIILSGQGIDVILGMSWIKMHKVVLDIVARLVHLNSPCMERLPCTFLQSLASSHPYIKWLKRILKRSM